MYQGRWLVNVIDPKDLHDGNIPEGVWHYYSSEGRKTYRYENGEWELIEIFSYPDEGDLPDKGLE